MMRMVSTKTIFVALGMLVITASACVAADKEHGTLVQESPIYVSPDLRAARVGTATRGLDTFLMERSSIDGKPWAHVLVTIQEGLVYPKQVSGWVDGRFVITPSIANGDQIIFGEAQDSSALRKIATDAGMREKMRRGFITGCMNTSPHRHWQAKLSGMRLICAGNWKRPASFHGLQPVK